MGQCAQCLRCLCCREGAYCRCRRTFLLRFITLLTDVGLRPVGLLRLGRFHDKAWNLEKSSRHPSFINRTRITELCFVFATGYLVVRKWQKLYHFRAVDKADDSVIIELNDALPTQSFHPVNSRETCESVGKRLAALQLERLSLIERCLRENEQRAKSLAEGSMEARIQRNTIRQIRAEFEVEEIIGARSRKAVDERCGKIF